MKQVFKILSGITMVLMLNSCVIDEPTAKPDAFLPANEMFDYTSKLLANEMRGFDKILFLEIYRQLDDSSKNVFNQQFFQQYLIDQVQPNVYVFLNVYNLEKVYTIQTDTNSIHTPGAVWKISQQNQPHFCIVSCIDTGKWELNDANLNYSNEYSVSLQFTCNDTIPAFLLQSTDFTITGSGQIDASPYSDRYVKIEFQISDALHYKGSINGIVEGSFDISADAVQRDKKVNCKAQFFVNDNNEQKIELNYQNKNKIVNNHLQYWYTW